MDWQTPSRGERMKDIFTSSIRVPKHDVPLIYTEVGINILKNKAEFKGKGDPFKSKNLYNVYFDNFFHPRNFNKTKIKKNINDYILILLVNKIQKDLICYNS